MFLVVLAIRNCQVNYRNYVVVVGVFIFEYKISILQTWYVEAGHIELQLNLPDAYKN